MINLNCNLQIVGTDIMLHGSFRPFTNLSFSHFSFLIAGNLVLMYLYPA